eukprot:829737-Amphidinium_carterae.3
MTPERSCSRVAAHMDTHMQRSLNDSGLLAITLKGILCRAAAEAAVAAMAVAAQCFGIGSKCTCLENAEEIEVVGVIHDEGLQQQATSGLICFQQQEEPFDLGLKLSELFAGGQSMLNRMVWSEQI